MWFSEWLRSLVFNPKNYFPFHLSQHVKNKSCSCLWNRSVPSENSALDIVAHLDLLLDNLLWVALLWAGAWTRWPPEVAADLSHSEFTGDKWLFADCVFILDIVVCFFFFNFGEGRGKFDLFLQHVLRNCCVFVATGKIVHLTLDHPGTSQRISVPCSATSSLPYFCVPL